MPVYAAERVAVEFHCRQVIVVAWDGERTHVVTFGHTADDSDQAAQGGNFVKTALGWPEQLCNTESPKVTELRRRIAELESQLAGTRPT